MALANSIPTHLKQKKSLHERIQSQFSSVMPGADINNPPKPSANTLKEKFSMTSTKWQNFCEKVCAEFEIPYRQKDWSTQNPTIPLKTAENIANVVICNVVQCCVEDLAPLGKVVYPNSSLLDLNFDEVGFFSLLENIARRLDFSLDEDSFSAAADLNDLIVSAIVIWAKKEIYSISN